MVIVFNGWSWINYEITLDLLATVVIPAVLDCPMPIPPIPQVFPMVLQEPLFLVDPIPPLIKLPRPVPIHIIVMVGFLHLIPPPFLHNLPAHLIEHPFLRQPIDPSSILIGLLFFGDLR